MLHTATSLCTVLHEKFVFSFNFCATDESPVAKEDGQRHSFVLKLHIAERQEQSSPVRVEGSSCLSWVIMINEGFCSNQPQHE